MDIVDIAHLASRERSPRNGSSSQPNAAVFSSFPMSASGWVSPLARLNTSESGCHVSTPYPRVSEQGVLSPRASFEEAPPEFRRRSSLELGLTRFQQSFKRYSVFN